MDKKEIAEIRKTLKVKGCCLDEMDGFYFDEKGAFLTENKVRLGSLPEEDFEKYCALFGKALSGKLGKTLYNVEFPIDEEKQAEIANLHVKIRNQRKDFINKLASKLVNEYDVVVVEDIDLRAMGGALSLGKNLHDNGLGMFREQLAKSSKRKARSS